jgi:DNA-binding beta-propeller fold protein YncE
MKKIITLLIGLLPILVLAQSKKMLTFSFSLASPARVSAGVYNGDVLVRTLFSNKSYEAGKHDESYEALDDDMNPIANTNGLTVKVLSNNVKYEWEGVIGNTSKEKSGNNIHRGFMSFGYLVINDNKAYYSKSYSEGSPAQNIFTLNNIQSKTRLFPNEPRGIGQATTAIATDSKNVYWGGKDPFGGKTKGSMKYANYVFATKTSDDAEVIFVKGVKYKNGIGRTQQSAIDITADSLASINGLAVQKKGRLLFVAHGYMLHVLDKNTGDLIKSITMPCAALAVDMQDDLWITTGQLLKKYSVGDDGSISQLLSLPAFGKPVAVAVSPDNNTVVVADAETSQQLKAFDNNSGTAYWTFGQRGGYYKSAAVTNDKFYFSDERQIYGVSIAFEKDGSFWLVDGGNCRVQHYTADRKFIERIMYLPHNYNIYVDPKVPERVFCDYLEFSVDYSKPLAPDNNSWTFVNNWGAFIAKDVDNKYLSLRPIKLSNGKTYALLMNDQTKRYEVMELTGNATPRFTGTFIEPKVGKYINAEGDIYTMPHKKINSPMLFTRQSLKGFDDENNPQWGAEETIARINKPGNVDPSYTGNPNTLRPGERTSNNVLLMFDGSGRGEGFHLGGIKIGDDKWAWRSARGTAENYRGDFPADGSYDIGNGVQYAGNVALAIDKYVFWGYHGEFWKSSQTNKWNQLYENGLMIGQFGVTGPEVKGQEAAPEMAGNVLAASVVKVNDNIYLYHNDEGHHSGVHRWKITGLNTIKEQTITISLVEQQKSKATRPLTERLTIDKDLEDSLDGWKMDPSNDIVIDNNRNWWTVKKGIKAHNKFEGTDINIRFRQKTPSQASLSKNLGVNNTNIWTLSGELNYDENFAEIETNKPGQSAGGQYFEVLDKNGKIIFRFFPLLNKEANRLKLIANHTIIAEDEQEAIKKKVSTFLQFTLKAVDGKLFFQYNSYPEKDIPIFELSANIKNPAMVRFYFWANATGANRIISFRNFEFAVE